MGVMVTGDAESGFEFGFNTGLDDVGVVGIIVGTVVMGVVMSFWSVEISTFLVALGPGQNKRQNRRNFLVKIPLVSISTRPYNFPILLQPKS